VQIMLVVIVLCTGGIVLDGSALRACVHYARLASGPSGDIRAPGLYAWELVLGCGAVCRRHRRVSPSVCK
jgi:hypothetical protein